MKAKKIRKLRPKLFVPYILAFFAIMGLLVFGSRDKGASTSSVSIASLASNNFNVSSDQLSEFYAVAHLADSMNLYSSETLSGNFISVSVMKDAGQSSTEKLEKPTVIDISDLSRDGIKTHIVSAGESMASIAGAYGVSTDQIRWSNGKKTEDISEGETLYIPGVPGIIYTVGSGESLDDIINKTGATRSQTLILNDKETNPSVSEGEKLILVDGVLPEDERPEYVPPAPEPVYYTYTYSYSGSVNSRIGLNYIAFGFYVDSPGNPGFPGQCTWYAWYMRDTDWRSQGSLPGGLGNANAWAGTLAARGYRVDNNPEPGAVFQTTAGLYGHVGYVLDVYTDGSVLVREMNYGITYSVAESVIPASISHQFNYIH